MAGATRLLFVTGASSGIGQALALHALRAGWNVALVARRADLMQAWARGQGYDEGRCRVYAADVAEITSIVQAGRDCIAQWGLPDVVIANAGISLGVDTSQREDLDVLARVHAVNTIGPAATFQPFIGPMQARGSGRLVLMASVAGVRGLPGHGAYCASKAAAISYAESLRGELRGSGVKVVTLSPGYVDTPLTRENPYGMPFLLAPEEFARRAWPLIEAGVRHRVIPWPMALVAAVLRHLPDAWYDRLLAGRPRKPRARAQ
jgi:short-subunit dehydrogenase